MIGMMSSWHTNIPRSLGKALNLKLIIEYRMSQALCGEGSGKACKNVGSSIVVTEGILGKLICSAGY